MAAIGGVLSGNISVIGGTTPTITDLPMPLAATEYTIVYPSGTKTVVAINNGSDIVEYGYVSGGPYMPLRIGQVMNLSGLTLAGPLTIYFKSASASQNIKSEHWV